MEDARGVKEGEEKIYNNHNLRFCQSTSQQILSFKVITISSYAYALIFMVIIFQWIDDESSIPKIKGFFSKSRYPILKNVIYFAKITADNR